MQINNYFFKICIFSFSFFVLRENVLAQVNHNVSFETDKIAAMEGAKFRTPLSPTEVLAGEKP